MEYELFFGDGVRFDLLPVVTYTYRRRGEPLRIPTPGMNVKVAVEAAVRWPDGPMVFTHGLWSLDTALFVGTLRKLRARARRTGKWVLLVLDNGPNHISGWARAEIERANDFVRIFWLPKYASEELNDLERVWKHVEEDYFSRMLVAHPDDFEPAVVGLLKELSRRRKILLEVLSEPTEQNHKKLLRTA